MNNDRQELLPVRHALELIISHHLGLNAGKGRDPENSKTIRFAREGLAALDTLPSPTASDVTAHLIAETEKLVAQMPPREPVHPRAHEFANAYHEYLEAAGDDGDMLLIMVDRLIRELEAQPMASGELYSQSSTCKAVEVLKHLTSEAMYDGQLQSGLALSIIQQAIDAAVAEKCGALVAAIYDCLANMRERAEYGLDCSASLVTDNEGTRVLVEPWGNKQSHNLHNALATYNNGSK